ncbi:MULTISPECIES: sensor histidine kinase [Bacillales]|uniref:sensor histidine kinase n=1 Tax=Bacillales TaxID=1385 RepID=UPI0006A7C53A|nr:MULTISPECIES: sensor histidine kinase [Bacillales]
MKRLRLNSFGARLLLWILLSTLVLLSGVTGVFYHYTTKQIDMRVGEAAQRNVSQAMDNFTLLTKGYDSLTKSIIGNVEIQRLLSKEETDPNLQFNKELEMMSALGSILYSYNDVKGIHVITRNGNVYSYETTTHALNRGFLKNEWYRQLEGSDGAMVWGGMLEETLTVRDDAVFVFGRVMTNLSTTRELGVLLIEADPKSFISSMNNLTIKPDSRSYVYSETNRLLVSSGPNKEAAPTLSDLARYSFLDEATDSSDSSRLIVTARDQKLGWKLLSITPKPVTMVERAEVNRYFIIVTSSLVLLAIMLAAFLSRSISRPIKSIVQEMRRVERGNLSTNLVSMRSYDEFNYLNEHFNRMITEINQLVERVKLAAASEKNSEIHALQSQVNPHFLYNTLDMIYWLLDEQGNDKPANLVLSLSRMFRYSSDWRSSLVSLKEELDQINHYLTIIQARSDGRIRVDINKDEQWLQTLLPKMTLQPLIENAVIHGLTQREAEGLIQIMTSEEGQVLYIHIRDNGKGMTKEKLEELRQSLRHAERLDWSQLEEEMRAHSAEPQVYGDSLRSGTGFVNVHRRLVLEYGIGYGIQIQSEENSGTTVTVMLPVLKPQP